VLFCVSPFWYLQLRRGTWIIRISPSCCMCSWTATLALGNRAISVGRNVTWLPVFLDVCWTFSEVSTVEAAKANSDGNLLPARVTVNQTQRGFLWVRNIIIRVILKNTIVFPSKRVLSTLQFQCSWYSQDVSNPPKWWWMTTAHDLTIVWIMKQNRRPLRLSDLRSHRQFRDQRSWICWRYLEMMSYGGLFSHCHCLIH
jgi:hypothetical protein